MKQMTPRTDACHEGRRELYLGGTVDYAFAAQLKTELNETTHLLESSKRARQSLSDACDSLSKELRETKAALEREQQDCAALRQMVRELLDALKSIAHTADTRGSHHYIKNIADAANIKANQLLP